MMLLNAGGGNGHRACVLAPTRQNVFCGNCFRCTALSNFVGAGVLRRHRLVAAFSVVARSPGLVGGVARLCVRIRRGRCRRGRPVGTRRR